MEQDKNINNNHLSSLIDSEKDLEKLKNEDVEIDLPGVEDIPGQEDFTPAPLGEIADTTISSADEEGEEIFNDNIDDDVLDDSDSNVSITESQDLAITSHDMPGDDEMLRESALDSTDEDGTPLNEGSFKTNISGSDLDVPGANLDNDEERIGEEDEENNEYSIAGTEDPPQDDF